jgi:hypothetical protein
MNDQSKTRQTPNKQTAPHLQDERGLSDAKMQEIRHLSDPSHEQEESDIM